MLDDERFMRDALAEARLAAEAGEVPVGAVVCLNGCVIGRGHNRTERLNDPTAHAEMLAIRAASAELGSWRLEGATLYVTLEPCSMCAGAIVLARIRRVVYGADDPRAGAVGSVMDVLREERLNHHPLITSGVLNQDCSELITRFFSERRRFEV